MKSSVQRVAQAYQKQSARGADILFMCLPDQSQGYYRAYERVADVDTQAAKLLNDIVEEFDKIFQQTSNQEYALTRLRDLVKNAGHWDAGTLRNNVFKIADLLGMKLPSMMFAAEEKVAAGRETKKEMRLKNNDVIPRGTSVEVKFLGRSVPDGYRVCALHMNFTGDSGRNYKAQPMMTAIRRLPDQVTGFKEPSLRVMEKWSEDGISMTPTGKRVEPDGYGPDGSPSWLLALGMI